MHFTREQIYQLAKQLALIAAKDSSFPSAKNVDSSTLIPVLQDNRNKLITITKLLGYILNNFDAKLIPVSIEGLNGDNLYDVLKDLLSRVGNDPLVPGDAGGVYYYNTLIKDSVTSNSVADALSIIIGMLYGYADIPAITTCTTQEIEKLLKKYNN